MTIHLLHGGIYMTNLDELIKNYDTNIKSVIICKDDEIQYEGYFDGFTEKDRIHIASVTKSIVSLLIGIALDKGFIESVDQYVMDFLKDYSFRQKIHIENDFKVRDLLSMTAAYKYQYEPYTKVYTSDDWLKTSLGLLDEYQEAKLFRYSTLGTHLLSGILVHATKQSVVDFAYENLFKPLEIEKPKSVRINNKDDYMSFIKDSVVEGWIVDPKGYHTAGWGLTLTSRDMMKIGQLVLNNGKWKNTELISKEYLVESTQKHSRWETLNLDYGYLWWILDEHRYAAIGDGGNIIYINQKERLVICIASSFKARPKDRVALIVNDIEPLFRTH